MADQVIYSESMRSETFEQPFLKKEIVYIQDNNSGGAYNGQVIFDSTQLSNSGKFISWKESFIVIPYVVAYKSTVDITAIQHPYMVGIKGAFWNLINSMSVEYNSTSVIQLTNNLGMWCTYKAVQSWSSDDYAKYGSTTNFFKDNVDSLRYRNAVGADVLGSGVSNNVLALPPAVLNATTTAGSVVLDGAALNAVATSYGINDGFLKRQQSIYTAGSDAFGNFLSAANAAASGHSIFQSNGGGGANEVYYNSFYAIIRLKDISDFFSELPLVKGSQIRITLNYHGSTSSITNAVSGGLNANGTFSLTTLPTITSGSLTPYVVSSPYRNNPAALVPSGTLSFYSNVSRVNVPGVAGAIQHPLTSCRLYAVLYTMNPIFEEQYISMNPTKTIVYRDIYQYTITDVATNGTVNTLISNGISSPKQLVIVPYISGRTVGQYTANLAALNGIDSLTSPLSTAPNMTDPYLALTDFNVQLSGVNMFQSNVVYGWDMFLNEISRIYSVNGGQTVGLTSGCLTQHEWEKGYRYHVVDLSRGYKVDDNIPKSVLLNCRNASLKNVDLYCFVEFQRQISISPSSGQIVQV